MADEVTKSSPWDVFINLLAVIALYVSAYAALSLLFQFINLALPDPVDQTNGVHDRIRYGISALFVFFPAYWWAWNSIETDLAANSGKRRLWVRTCPIYLTLFVAGMLALGDFSCLLYYFLSGDLTSRFALKVGSVLLVAGAVLIFYRDALRRDPGPMPPTMRTLAYTCGALASSLIVAGFVVAGPPMHAHLARLDDERIQNLDSVQQKIVGYWQDKGELPSTLNQLKDDISGYSPERDPQTGEAYGYRKTGTTSFELCAEFGLKDSDASKSLNPWRRTSTSTAWNHDSGHYCFERTIDPARYPPKKASSN